jgi:hypothetical protein
LDPTQTYPAVPAGLTPSWITSALSSRYPDVAVESFTVEPVGTGQIAATFRVSPRYRSPESSGPATLILKCPPADPAFRQVAQRTGSYKVEILFYRELSRTLDVQVPDYWADECDETTGDFLLLLGDAAPAQPGDQLAGCTAAQAELAIDELVRLHTPFWNRSGVDVLPWIRHKSSESKTMIDVCTAAAEKFLLQYDGRLGPETSRLAGRLGELLTGYLATEWGSDRSVVHGDYRIDNLLFRGDTERPVVVDWGGLAEGPPIADVSYLLGGSLPTDERRDAEPALVRRYHDHLVRAGIAITWAECWRQYCIHAVSGMLMATIAPTVVLRTERGDEMFLAMAERHAAQIRELGTVDLVLAG